MFCKYCGAEVEVGTKFCPICGYDLSAEEAPKQPTALEDSDSVGWFFLGFFIPLAGLILFFVWRDQRPKAGKRALRGAITSVVLYFVLYVAVVCSAILATYGSMY